MTNLTLEQEAINLLRDNEPKEGYHLAFSGGKDSVIIKELARLSGVKFKAHFARTSIDPPELLDFIREYHKDVIWHRPEITMYQLIIKNKALPMRQMRFCCRYLKEYLGVGENVITGIRAKESHRRAKREQIEDGNDGKKFNHPIFYWSEKQVWNYIRNNNIPYCKLYDEGFLRIGCIGCPNHTKNQHTYIFNRYPMNKIAYINTINKLIKIGKYKDFDNAEDVFNWWTSSKSANKYLAEKRQLELAI